MDAVLETLITSGGVGGVAAAIIVAYLRWQRTHPVTPVAPVVPSAPVIETRHYRHVHHIDEATIDRLTEAVVAIIEQQHRVSLSALEPARKVQTPEEPETRIAYEMGAAIKNGTQAIMKAVAERGMNISEREARLQAAEMLFSTYNNNRSELP